MHICCFGSPIVLDWQKSYIRDERCPRYRGYPNCLLYRNSSAAYTKVWCKYRITISVYKYVVQIPHHHLHIVVCHANTADSACTSMWCKYHNTISVLCGANTIALSACTSMWCKYRNTINLYKYVV